MAEDNKLDSMAMLTEIYREVGETKTTIGNVDTKLDKHIDYSLNEFGKINTLDAEQNRILDKHIEGVNTLKEMHIAHRAESEQKLSLLQESIRLQKDEHDQRINALEKPYDLLKLAGKVFVWCGGIAGALYAIAQLIIVLGVFK